MKRAEDFINKRKEPMSGRYLLYNWRESPESNEDKKLIRYYFDIVDDKFREQKILRIFDEIQNYSFVSFNFEQIGGDYEGKVGSTGLRYLTRVYDSLVSPHVVELAIRKVFPGRNKKDENLYDRVKRGTSLEKYLEGRHFNN
jgi:uncharacterized protein YktA (UPF0223 family)